MKTKSQMDEMRALICAGRRKSPHTSFEKGVLSAMGDAARVPSRELRRWSAKQLDLVQQALRFEAADTVREFNTGRRWMLAWIRAP